MAGWRFLATRLHGDGTETLLKPDLPLSDVAVTPTLSGVPTLDATIPVEVPGLDRATFTPWSTAVYAELDDVIRGAGIVTDAPAEDGKLTVQCDGWVGYLKGLPFDDVAEYVEADPLDIARGVWAHVQGKPRGDIGLELDVDPASSPIRLGEQKRDVEFTTGDGDDVGFEAGPYTLAWWKTQDLGQAWDDLATQGGFDYWEEHRWADAAKTRIRHILHINYPAAGRRRTDLRFKVGERDMPAPAVEWSGQDYASEVIVLGSGEGSDMVRADWPTGDTSRLRRVHTVSDKGLDSKAQARTVARREAAKVTGGDDVAQVVLPLGGWSLGDTITLVGDGTGWAGDLRLPVRILSYDLSPDDTDRATVSVMRAEAASNG